MEGKKSKPEYPLRERRRRQTRAALIDAAQELMSAREFTSVTMQEVADRAGVHAQTLYSHFNSKSALGAAVSVESLRAALKTRTTDTLTFWRDWVEQRARATVEAESGAHFMRFVFEQQTDPRLAPLTQAIAYQHIGLLTRNLATDFGQDPRKDLFPKLVAHMLWGANEHNVLAWQEAEGGYDLVAGAVRAVDDVADIVELVRSTRQRRADVVPAES